jgi:uncharacterized protein
MPADIRHDADHHRFFTEIDGRLAYTHYMLKPGVITFTHTEVAPELEGRGIASSLARAGLDYARTAGLKVVAMCPFVAAFIRGHPAYQDLLAEPLPPADQGAE